MEAKENLAKEYFNKGYNCAQAALMAFADEVGLDKTIALKLASSFGGGMGKLREVCGALSAIFMVAGMKYGYSDISLSQDEKGKHYKLIQDMANEFKNEYGSLRCADLIKQPYDKTSTPSERTDEYYASRPCERYVVAAVKIMEKYSEKMDEISK